jgi:hypothetical protein
MKNTEQQAAQPAPTQLEDVLRAAHNTPDGYAYRYPDGIRFNDGHEVNGSKPIESIPYFLGVPPSAPAQPAPEELAQPKGDEYYWQIVREQGGHAALLIAIDDVLKLRAALDAVRQRVLYLEEFRDEALAAAQAERTPLREALLRDIANELNKFERSALSNYHDQVGSLELALELRVAINRILGRIPFERAALAPPAQEEKRK